MALFGNRDLAYISLRGGGRWSGTVSFDRNGCLLVDDVDVVAVAQLAPEHAYYLAAMLTKWADAQETEDNS